MLVVNNLNCSFFFFNDTATTEIYTLSLHDALPISDVSQPPVRDGSPRPDLHRMAVQPVDRRKAVFVGGVIADERSEEHTSELQSQSNLVCRLLLEKNKNTACATAHRENVNDPLSAE